MGLDRKTVMRSFKILHSYLTNDQAVHSGFQPNVDLLRKMNFEEYVMSENNKDSETALELCGFIMRYYRAIDYSDFTDDVFTVKRIRRFMEFKQWSEIEDLQNLTDVFSTQFELFKNTN